MLDSMIPVIRQLHEADGDHARARILLQCPDAVLLKYHPVFRAACERARFDAGVAFVEGRVALMHAVRDADGLLPFDLSKSVEDLRQSLVRYVANWAALEL